eukprot:TRINITY_DN41837_c0_g1_i1.p1 TRINITY_DN41837_c0_g1~~TRINITY_DN41837_c0_g1_i1.p1  ORF type:complete len:397 (+),score=72.12 TRINITY_DN41837_c0_g1_i1:154-1344(+)
MAGTTGFKLFAILVIIQVEAKPRIVNLSGEPDFRKVTLRWQVDPDGETVTGMFRVKYCENQVWGEHFCRHKSVRQKPTQENFSADILGLKMSTNYTFYLETDVLQKSSRKERKIKENVVLQTRGFSARATDCRRDTTEVLLETGPHFGGKISAEGREHNCFIKGKKGSSNSSYSFTIDHKKCGTSINKTSVWTYVVVQENLPILTHSTRRFLVLCHFKMPEVFTVKAGFNLPGGNIRGSGSLKPVSILSEEFRSGDREGRRYSNVDYDLSSKIITAASLEEARLARMLTSPRHSASQRQSRTLASNLFGGLDFGDRNQRADPASHNLWMVVLIVSAGGVVLTVCGMLVACKPRKGDSDCDNVSSDDVEESNAASQVVNDTEALQPKRKHKPRESRA